VLPLYAGFPKLDESHRERLDSHQQGYIEGDLEGEEGICKDVGSASKSVSVSNCFQSG
jgi:hypothetical protein